MEILTGADEALDFEFVPAETSRAPIRGRAFPGLGLSPLLAANFWLGRSLRLTWGLLRGGHVIIVTRSLLKRPSS